ncbi:MAG: putative Zn-dependent peptidase [Acidobacteria bacterium]|nr:putative Zn-dependent peptidase [Acidobacteriota bacterium]
MNQQDDFRRYAPAPLPSSEIKIPTPYQTVLPNGLTLVVVEDKRLPLVSYRLAFRTGDAHDPPELPGLTDMMAGLLTEGTVSRTSRQIAEEVERMGATLHAGAGSDFTTLSASALAVFGDKILELMADVTLRPSFPENEVELTKQNTKESLKQQRAQPSFLANEMVSRVMFGEHPYSRIVPTPESIDNTTRERLVEFHRSVFVPNNAVFLIVGDVDRAVAEQNVAKLFGDWPRSEAVPDSFPQPPDRTKRVAYVIDRPGSAQSNIVISSKGVNRTNPDYFPLLLMHTVLGATASSRLFMNLREEKGYTYGAYSNLDTRRTAGTIRATAEVRTPVTGDSLKEFFYELDRIGSEPVTEKEISDAKSYLTGVFPIRLETQEGLIDQLVQIKMLGLPDNYLQLYREQVQKVTREEIQEVAQKYVRPDEAAIVIVGDGAQVLEQLERYCSEIEFYNTAGKKKDRPTAVGVVTESDDSSLAGTWSLEIQTPFGQDVAATLTLNQNSEGFSGKVESEMGQGELANVTRDGPQFQATLSFAMEGAAMDATISGSVAGSRMDGTISLKNLPALSFSGHRAE